MCAPIAGQSELLFFINHPKRQPSRKTLIESFITPPENPCFETQYGQWININRSEEITLAIQKLSLSFNWFRKNPLKSISSHIGEKKTPIRMLSQSDDRRKSIAPAFLWVKTDSPTTTRESQTTRTITPAMNPRLFTGAVSLV